jgi:hypothetical protein
MSRIRGRRSSGGKTFPGAQFFQSSPGMIRFMNSSNNGTVKAVSPWLGLQIIPFTIN